MMKLKLYYLLDKNMLPHKETFNIIYTLLATVESSLLISRYNQTKQIIYSI